MWVFDSDTGSMVWKTVTMVPGLYKIFDEILVNAADNKIRDPRMDALKVTVDKANNTISVWNNGQGIPIQMHSVRLVLSEIVWHVPLLTMRTERKSLGSRVDLWPSSHIFQLR